MSTSAVTTAVSVLILIFCVATCSAWQGYRMRNRPTGSIQRSNSQYENGLFTKKQLSKIFSDGCGLVLNMKCQSIAQRCHTGVLTKRSIDNEQENQNTSTTKLERRRMVKRRRRRRNRGRKIFRKMKISCVICRSRCWY